MKMWWQNERPVSIGAHLAATKRRATTGKRARLYHLTERTIAQIDTLAVMYGIPKEQAVAEAIDATYRAAAQALARMRVKVRRPTTRRSHGSQ